MKLFLVALPAALLAGPVFAQHEEHGMPPEAEMAHSDEAMAPAMTGALGPYAMTREASGTAWQPDDLPHAGVHVTAGRDGAMIFVRAAID
jgi:hypothetical protein